MNFHRRFAFTVSGVAVGIAIALGAGTSGSEAQSGCDPNYAPVGALCVRGDRDYDCPELHAIGLGDIPVIGVDWQRLDGYYSYAGGYWESYPDGLGCEWYGE